MQISKRLEAVASFVEQGSVIADVGCDHGYIPIYLYQKGMIPKAIAMDVNKGPLERAEIHIREYGLGEYITTRLSDGVRALKPNEADAVVIAGMGGALMEKIIEEGEETLKSVSYLILSHSLNWHISAGFFTKKDIVSSRKKWSWKMANIIQ